MAKYNWDKIKCDYLAGDYKNLREYAEKEHINYDVLRRKASKWQEEKSQVTAEKVTKIVTKAVEKIATREANRIARVYNLADRLADKLEEAIEQLEQYSVTNKVKTKTVEYDEDTKKIAREIVVEEEVKQTVDGIIDKRGLKMLTAVLKDIKDIQMTSEERQRLELEKMRAEVQKISEGTSHGDQAKTYEICWLSDDNGESEKKDHNSV